MSFNLSFFLEPGGRKTPGLYADIPLPVLLVSVGEEGGPGGLPNLLKKEEKEENEEEKKEDNDNEEEMGGGIRNGEQMEGGMSDDEYMQCRTASWWRKA